MSDSKYKTIKKLGQGGMGIVYLGYDQVLDRHVAIKVLSPELSSNSEFIERFLREARVCAKLNHQNIVKIFDFGKIPGTGQVFFVMEFVDGESLTNYIKFNKIESENRFVEICKNVLSGLKYSHDMGILHRDIKPDNILINKEGIPILMDFGIAKSSQDEEMTKTGTLLGTLAYMSPEQALSNELNCQTDLYSFGIVMYQMVTGKVPFKGDAQKSTLWKHLNEIPVPPSQMKNSISSELEKIILKAIQKDKNIRYQNAAEIINDLNNYNIQVNETTPLVLSPEILSQSGQNTEKNSAIIKSSRFGIRDILVKSMQDGKFNFGEMLFDAITDKDMEVINFLIELNVPLNFVGRNDLTPLMHSIRFNSQEVFDLLISYKVDVNYKNKNGETPLMIACGSGDLETVKILIKKGADPNIKNIRNEIAFNYSNNNGYLETSNYLLNISSNTSPTDEINMHKKENPFQNGDLTITEILSENLSNGNFNPGYELFQSIENNKNIIASLLIKDKLTDINIKDKKSNTPLHQSVKFNNIAIAVLLINNNADCNIVNDSGETPLHIACYSKNIEIVKLLIDKTDHTVKTLNNKSIIDLARESGNKEIIKIVEAHIKSKSPSLINKFMGIFKK